MVYGIIFFQIDKTQIEYQNFYESEGNDANKNLRINFIIREVMNDFVFKKHCQSFRQKGSESQGQQEENMCKIFDKNFLLGKGDLVKKYLCDQADEQNGEGCLFLNNPDFFKDRLVQLWYHLDGLFITLILAPKENIALAANFLNIIKNQIENKKLKIEIIPIQNFLEKYLPNGQLLFIKPDQIDK